MKMLSKRRRNTIALITGVSMVALLSSCGGKTESKNVVPTEEVVESPDEGGFYYDDFGNRYSYGYSDVTAEDVVYTYVKSLSLLDFNTAMKYVYSESQVINGFDDEKNTYDGTDSGYGVDYNFNHKIYKETLRSLMIDSVVDTVIYEDGYVITVNLRHLDCNNNEFWLKDKESIFAELLTYELEEESRDAENKSNEYLASYIKDFYGGKEAPTTVNEVEFKLVKSSTGAWVVEDDSDLYALCSYNDGEYMIRFIKNEFSKWYDEYLQKYNK